jgi:adenosylhomocysteine nucleosidase
VESAAGGWNPWSWGLHKKTTPSGVEQILTSCSQIAIIAALRREITPFLQSGFPTQRIRSEPDYVFRFDADETSGICCVSGVGLNRMLECVSHVLETFNPSLVIGTGYCGGLTKELNPGDVVLASEITKSNGESDPIPCDISGIEGLRENLNAEMETHAGRIVTVGEAVTEPDAKKILADQTGAIAVDMESFALAQTCEMRSVPWLVIRSVSDTVEDRLPEGVKTLTEGKSFRGALQLAAAGLTSAAERAALERLRQNSKVAGRSIAGALNLILSWVLDPNRRAES